MLQLCITYSDLVNDIDNLYMHTYITSYNNTLLNCNTTIFIDKLVLNELVVASGALKSYKLLKKKTV